MAYKIAVATRQEERVDETFGEPGVFVIYQVNGDLSYEKLEIRKKSVPSNEAAQKQEGCTGGGCGTRKGGCGAAGGAESPLVALIADCRCVICKKIGFSVQKQLEKRTIVSFDVECGIDEALEKIIFYFDRMDHHRTLRGIAQDTA